MRRLEVEAGGKRFFTAEGVNVSYLQGRFGAMALSAAAAALVGFAAQARADDVTVALSLTKFPAVVHTPAGDVVGVAPAVLHVHVGDRITFKNEDTRSHTATGLTGATFVQDPAWTDESLKPMTVIGAAPWSTGEIRPGGTSSQLTVKTPGTYLYGCFYDYSAGMRGEIVVEP